MTGRHSLGLRGTAALLVAAMALQGCENSVFEAKTLGDLFTVNPQPVTAPEPPADANGVINFPDFRLAVARQGDTMTSIANRIGIEPGVLSRYNGLPLDYLIRPGERFAIPNSAQIRAVEAGWTPDIVSTALDRVPDGSAPASSGPAPAAPPGNLPVRHSVEPGETAFSIARLYGVSVTALASWNGLGGDLTVTPGRSLIIPVTETAPTQLDPGVRTEVTPPPSAEAPLPEDSVVATTPDGPDLQQFRTEASGAVRFLTPVSGKVVKGFSRAQGRAKNDGLDYETAKDAPVKAAGDGEVALISRSLGGLGTIVLVRHADDYITVYGRIDDVSVNKGDAVSSGQTIGRVADGNPPIFHFEIRRGTEAVDPIPFLK